MKAWFTLFAATVIATVVYGARDERAASLEDRYWNTFDRADVNGNGQLDADEAMAVGVSGAGMDELDSDGDRALSREEFEVLARSMTGSERITGGGVQSN